MITEAAVGYRVWRCGPALAQRIDETLPHTTVISRKVAVGEGLLLAGPQDDVH